jgi:diguanylate cyclase (GGDEF)-like protein/PAS domain S-box-containing protein
MLIAFLSINPAVTSSRPLRVLVVEDSEDDALLVLRELRRSDYDVVHERVETREQMADALDRQSWDVVLSDHSLPSFSEGGGLALLRERGLDLPFIIVSGAIGEEIAVDAMRAGAHDYVMKGNLNRLVPALERELREAAARRQTRNAEEALRRAEGSVRRLAAIVESSDDAIVSMSPAGTIETWNPGAERLYGYTAAEMIGCSIAVVAAPSAETEVMRLVQQVTSGEHAPNLELEARRKAGAAIAVTLTLSPIRDALGAIVGVSGIARDITERKQFETQLRHLAEHDGLTGLLNRRRFEDELSRAVAAAGRYGEVTGLAVIDVDNFKYINDTLGHRIGDELIREVGAVLDRRSRKTDVVARLGGDEFAILLTHTSADRARTALEQVLAKIREQTLVARDRHLRVTASAGLVTFSDDRLGADELLAAADLTMYEAKEAGRDRLAVNAATVGASNAMEHRFTWAERIRDALDQNLFRLYHQPILDLSSDTISRHEILLRMTDAQGTVIAPGAFLATAERFGLINGIDQWVVKGAIALIAEHQRAGRAMSLEVNLSGRSIDDPALPELIEAELANSSVDPASLTFEITETAAITNMDLARSLAQRLTSLGCRFALDDFGAGFASFYYLKHLPLHYVKIDGGFIRELPRSATDRLVVKAMVEIAQGMGLQTIAEFVEDAETLELLRELGVDYAQGYHVARPRPTAELLEALPTPAEEVSLS